MRYVVANPGSNPELMRLASALHLAGRLALYVTPVTRVVRERLPQPLRLLPEPLQASLLRRIARRDVPLHLPDDLMIAKGTLAELTFKALHGGRVPHALQVGAMRSRTAWFDREVSKLLVPGLADAVVGLATASAHTFRAASALGIKSVLNYPIAHHDFSARYLREVAEEWPDWASTLQWAKFSGYMRRRLDTEVALADQVLVLTEFQRETFALSGVPRQKLQVTNLGLDGQLFAPRTKQGAADSSGALRLLFVGQLTQRKGLSYLLEAFLALPPGAATLTLVGQPEPSAARLLQRPGVTLHPHVPRHQLPDVYAAHDVFVFPSLIEGFPQTPLEAMACGLPCVLSSNCYGGDVVTDGYDALVVPPRDSGALATAIERLIDSPALRVSLGRAAYETAKRFSWQRYEERVLEVLP